MIDDAAQGAPHMLLVGISELTADLLRCHERANQGEQITVTTKGRVLVTIAAPVDRKLMAQQRLRELAETATIDLFDRMMVAQAITDLINVFFGLKR
ncbi:hypothetical protein [Allohahella sp. A8]|uniref:hypothetical protein n=1 Tax=Allohahella sp. A8 TaxID=3141461 RepID=UPI003A813DDB